MLSRSQGGYGRSLDGGSSPSLTRTDSGSGIKAERRFFSPLLPDRQPSVLLKSPRKASLFGFPACSSFRCRPAIQRFTGAWQTTAASWALCRTSQVSFEKIIFFCCFHVHVHVCSRRNNLVFTEQLCFGPLGPPSSLWL